MLVSVVLKCHNNYILVLTESLDMLESINKGLSTWQESLNGALSKCWEVSTGVLSTSWKVSTGHFNMTRKSQQGFINKLESINAFNISRVPILSWSGLDLVSVKAVKMSMPNVYVEQKKKEVIRFNSFVCCNSLTWKSCFSGIHLLLSLVMLLFQ